MKSLDNSPFSKEEILCQQLQQLREELERERVEKQQAKNEAVEAKKEAAIYKDKLIAALEQLVLRQPL